MVSFITPSWAEHLGFTPAVYDVVVSYKHDIAYKVSQYPSGFAYLCFFLNSRNEASSCDPEKHKQFCLPRGGLPCPSPDPGLPPVSFASKSVTKDEVHLGFGGSLLPCDGFLQCSLVSVVGIATTPANPGSLLIAACHMTNLARSFRPGIGPFCLMEYDTSAHLLIK